MSFLKRQQAGKEIGRIRLGNSVAVEGKDWRRPQKLETFRLTTRSQSIAAAAAELFGGTVHYDVRVGFDVVTTSAELPVLVPPGEILSQLWELWKGGECQRRCSDDICTLPDRSEVPCLCPPQGAERIKLAAEGRACKPTTRLNVIIPDLPDLGVWRLESHGYDAAISLGSTAEFLGHARDAGHMLPARLWIDTRTKVVEGQTRKWQVPMLSLQHSMRQLAAGNADMQAMMPPEPRLAIAAGTMDDDATDAPAVAAHKEAWAGPIVTPPASEQQALADRALESTSVPLVRALKVRAHEKGWDDDMVTIEGADEALGGFLQARLERLELATP